MTLHDGLNPAQRQAVETIRGPLLILAGAGTGKTRVITHRISHMLASGISPKSIVAVSFTNKAAREMRARLNNLIAPTLSRDIFLGTFHSFCLTLLRRFHTAAGLTSDFQVIATSEQLDLVRKAMEEKGWSGIYRHDIIHGHISRAKNILLSAEAFLDANDTTLNEILPLHSSRVEDDPDVVQQVYSLYERQLRLNRAIDFDDCIYKSVLMVQDSQDVQTKLHECFQYFLVDEFQDTNLSQLKLLSLLCAPPHHICAVGDDDQSIYSWRGARSETLDEFEKLFPGTQQIFLEQNYRSSNVILGAANHVIANNLGRRDKNLWSESKIDHPIEITEQENESTEAGWIAEKCLGYMGRGFRPSDIAILYRTNGQSRPLELALREHHVRYKTFGGSSFFERKEVKDFLSYLQLAAEPNARIPFWRVVNTPARGLGLKSLEKIESICAHKKISPYTAINQGLIALPSGAASGAQAFVALIDKLHAIEIYSPDDAKKLGGLIISDGCLLEDARQKTKDPATRIRKIETLKSLPNWLALESQNILDMARSRNDNRKTAPLTLAALIDHLTLTDFERANDEDSADQHVSLMTIHAAKGLEFGVVFVCGVEEDLLPHKNSQHNSTQLAEERRLFYVAITRAKEWLHLSHALERSSSGLGPRAERKPSRFLKELDVARSAQRRLAGATRTVISGPPIKTVEEKRTDTLRGLSNLKSRLADWNTQKIHK